MGLFGDNSAVKAAQAQAAQQQAQLAQQEQEAETQAVSGLQDKLSSQTNQMARVFGTKALLAGSGMPGVKPT